MEFLTTLEVAKRKNMTRGRVCQLIWAGIIPARKWGRDWQILESDLDKVNWPQYKGRGITTAFNPKLKPGPITGLRVARRWPKTPK